MTAGGQPDHESKQVAGRLGSFLQDLAQARGQVRTALLGANHLTLVGSLESGI